MSTDKDFLESKDLNTLNIATLTEHLKKHDIAIPKGAKKADLVRLAETLQNDLKSKNPFSPGFKHVVEKSDVENNNDKSDAEEENRGRRSSSRTRTNRSPSRTTSTRTELKQSQTTRRKNSKSPGRGGGRKSKKQSEEEEDNSEEDNNANDNFNSIRSSNSISSSKEIEIPKSTSRRGRKTKVDHEEIVNGGEINGDDENQKQIPSQVDYFDENNNQNNYYNNNHYNHEQYNNNFQNANQEPLYIKQEQRQSEENQQQIKTETTNERKRNWKLFSLSSIFTQQNIAYISIGIVLLAIGFFIYQKLTTPLVYCDNGFDPKPGYLSTCIACPPNAHCVNGSMNCDAGYVKSWSWNFAGECVKKAELETIHAVGRNFLSVQRGYFDCELSPDEGLNTTELIRKISNATSLNFHIEDLDLAFKDDEDAKKNATTQIWTIPSSFGVRPVSCVLWQFAVRYLWFVSIVGSIFGIYFYLKYRNRRIFKDKQNVDSIVQKVFSKLSIAAQRSREAAGRPEVHLRDELLPLSLFSVADRQRLWSQVIPIIERDSRIQQTTRQLGGVSFKTWEWIAAPYGDETVDLTVPDNDGRLHNMGSEAVNN